MFYADTSDKIISEFYKITSNISWNNYQQDNLGQMWIGAGSRLSRGTLQPDGSWKWVSAPFSRFANENIYEVYVDKNDVTWFGTDDGIIKYDFGKKNLGSKDYAALVRSVEIGEDSTIYFGGKVESFLSPEITFKNNSVKFRYSATSYEGKNVNKFKTFLDGFDDGWSRYSPETIKEYTNLPPGKYTFKVAALNLSGIESSTGTYSFEILPPWYRTLWAYAFYVLFLAAGIFVVDRVQRKRLLGKERERAEIERKNREFEEARKLQLSMLPEEIPKIPGLDIAVYMKTATEVGGDYYDLINTDDTLTAIIGDATGHGLNAGMLVSVTKGMFQNLAFQNELEKMISQFMRLQPMYMSLALTRIMNNRLQVVGAGMPPFLYYQSKSGIVTEIESSGPPLGGFPGFNYKVSDYELSAGDFIVMMSDGFPERRNANKEIYGWDKGKELLSNITHLGSEQIIEELVKAGDEWGGDRQQDDDITFVVFKIV